MKALLWDTRCRLRAAWRALVGPVYQGGHRWNQHGRCLCGHEARLEHKACPITWPRSRT